jgi:hypothetical protein
LAALTAGLSACSQPPEAPTPLALRRDLSPDSALLLPSTEPPGLVDAWLTSGNETALVSFYSLNQPMVTICQAPSERCRELLPTARTLPHPAADVTVMVETQEAGAKRGLSDALVSYWSEVELVPGIPGWLEGR